jgi:hypothetical protein
LLPHDHPSNYRLCAPPELMSCGLLTPDSGRVGPVYYSEATIGHPTRPPPGASGWRKPGLKRVAASATMATFSGDDTVGRGAARRRLMPIGPGSRDGGAR